MNAHKTARRRQGMARGLLATVGLGLGGLLLFAPVAGASSGNLSCTSASAAPPTAVPVTALTVTAVGGTDQATTTSLVPVATTTPQATQALPTCPPPTNVTPTTAAAAVVPTSATAASTIVVGDQAAPQPIESTRNVDMPGQIQSAAPRVVSQAPAQTPSTTAAPVEQPVQVVIQGPGVTTIPPPTTTPPVPTTVRTNINASTGNLPLEPLPSTGPSPLIGRVAGLALLLVDLGWVLVTATSDRPARRHGSLTLATPR